jgi:hypothetical protein
MIFGINSDYFPKQRQPTDFVMDTRCVLFEVGAKFLNII